MINSNIKNYPWLRSGVIIFLTFNWVISIDNPHFYKGTHFFGEPRLSKNYLNTIDFWAGGGKTNCGYDSHRNKTNILSIYGNDNLRFIGKGVSENILDKLDNPYIANIWRINNDSRFGQLKFNGKFRVRVYDLDIIKNFIMAFL
jgi:hypothetical protein